MSCSYPARDLAFDAALDAQRRDEARDYSEEDFVDLDMPDCENAANEQLCEIIMEKACSYSVDEAYSARAYKRAAEKIASLPISVFTLTDAQQRRLGVGPKTNQFIYKQILGIKPPEQEMSHLQEEFIALQKHIEDLLRLTYDKPEYYEILSSLQGKMVELRMKEQADRYMASKKASK
jgi:hypothetical protein